MTEISSTSTVVVALAYSNLVGIAEIYLVIRCAMRRIAIRAAAQRLLVAMDIGHLQSRVTTETLWAAMGAVLPAWLRQAMRAR